MRLKYLFISFLFFFSLLTLAQKKEKCKTDFLHNKYIQNHPEAKENVKQNEMALKDFIRQNIFHFKSSEKILIVPIVIHIMHLGEDEGVANNISINQIQSGIEQLNNAYRNINGFGEDMGIEFALAVQNPNGESTSGIIRYDASNEAEYVSNGVSSGGAKGLEETYFKGLSKWPKNQYYNIWIVSEIDGNNGEDGILGFAYLPGASAEYDGTVIQNTSWGDQGTVNNWDNLGTTIIHELGHGLGLYHTFNTEKEQDTDTNGCPLNTDCSTQGDFCCDTDPHQVSSSNSCDTSQINKCTGNLLSSIVQNYMDYSNQECQVMFTADQKSRMRGVLQTSRKSLLNSKSLNESIAACDDPPEAFCSPQTQSYGLGAPFAGIGTFEIENKTINVSFTSFSDNGYLNNTSECSVTSFLNPDSSYKLKILPVGPNLSYSKAWIDYNNDSFFSNEEMIYEGTHSGEENDSAIFTIPVNAEKNKFLRLRASLDLDPIDGPCYEPKYGQVEDYSVYLFSPEVANFVNQETNSKKLTVYPNPVKSILTIELYYGDFFNAKLFIRDLHGKLIDKELIISKSKFSKNIDVSGYQKGIYNVSIQNNSEIISQNFVVK